MKMQQKLSIANGLRYTSLISISIISILVFGFALVSGAENYGGGFTGILKNSPNALPWMALIVLAIVSWRNALLGGILTTLFGIVVVYFFNFSGPNFFLSTFIITSSIVLIGIMLLASHLINNKI